MGFRAQPSYKQGYKSPDLSYGITSAYHDPRVTTHEPPSRTQDLWFSALDFLRGSWGEGGVLQAGLGFRV